MEAQRSEVPGQGVVEETKRKPWKDRPACRKTLNEKAGNVKSFGCRIVRE